MKTRIFKVASNSRAQRKYVSVNINSRYSADATSHEIKASIHCRRLIANIDKKIRKGRNFSREDKQRNFVIVSTHHHLAGAALALVKLCSVYLQRDTL